MVILRALQAWPSSTFLPTIMGMEVVLIVAASLALALHAFYGVAIFVILVSLALGLQNGAFRRVGAVSVHTTYLTGMITSLISTEAEGYARRGLSPLARVPDPQKSLLCGGWLTFVLGAGTGAAMVFHFKAFGMLRAALILIPLVPRQVQS